MTRPWGAQQGHRTSHLHPEPKRHAIKPADTQAARIQWGIELETRLPAAASVAVGAYHNGTPVQSGITLSGQRLDAPVFGRARWKAERDDSIQCDAGQGAL